MPTASELVSTASPYMPNRDEGMPLLSPLLRLTQSGRMMTTAESREIISQLLEDAGLDAFYGVADDEGSMQR